MSTLLRIVLLAAAFAGGTYVAGWWAVPVLGFAWGYVASATPRPVFVPTLAAVAGWAALIFWDSTGPRFRAVGGGLGAVLQLNGAAYVELVILFVALLAFAASGAGHSIRRTD